MSLESVIFSIFFVKFCFGRICERTIPRISVVIPVFNREVKVAACLGSVLQQSLKNLEVICVDDGSTDQTFRILEDFAKLDTRIIVLHQENCGASCARNAGLAASTGEYVNFVDSDDWIEFNTYEIVYEKAKKYGVDVVAWGRIDERYNTSHGPSKEVVLIGVNCTRAMYPAASHYCFSVCTKLFKRSVLKDNCVAFDEAIRWGEDLLFNFDLVPFVNAVLCLNQTFYHYTYSQNGLYRSRRNSDALVLADGIVRHLEIMNNDDTTRIRLTKEILHEIMDVVKMRKKEKRKKRRKRSF